jgi:hypothetical protein
MSFDRDTPVCSKNKQPLSYSFDKSVSRSFLDSSLNTSSELIYFPNKELVMPSLGKTIPFDKTRSRPALFSLKEEIDSHPFTTDAVTKHLKVVNFKHAKSRRKVANLPLYLQDLHDRFAVGHVLPG